MAILHLETRAGHSCKNVVVATTDVAKNDIRCWGEDSCKSADINATGGELTLDVKGQGSLSDAKIWSEGSLQAVCQTSSPSVINPWSDGTCHDTTMTMFGDDPTAPRSSISCSTDAGDQASVGTCEELQVMAIGAASPDPRRQLKWDRVGRRRGDTWMVRGPRRLYDPRLFRPYGLVGATQAQVRSSTVLLLYRGAIGSAKISW